MQIYQSIYQSGKWQTPLPSNSDAHWLLVLGSGKQIKSAEFTAKLQMHFPNAQIMGCSADNEIHNQELYEDAVCLTAVTFESTEVKVLSGSVTKQPNERLLAKEIVTGLLRDDLQHVFLLADGHNISGSELVAGFNQYMPTRVNVTGGMAGSSNESVPTFMLHNNQVKSGLAIAVGFYGNKLRVGHGHLGGWKAFGPERVVTKSEGNLLYEFDNLPALQIYKEYLGEYAPTMSDWLLRFPISIRSPNSDQALVRTVLAIDEEKQAMKHAGDIPEGSLCQLMRANYENLVDGAASAAQSTLTNMDQIHPQLAILVSCIGRKMVMGQRVEEELEAVQHVIKAEHATGFYSYGEISPIVSFGRCGLHNQTMTITAFSEC